MPAGMPAPLPMVSGSRPGHLLSAYTNADDDAKPFDGIITFKLSAER